MKILTKLLLLKEIFYQRKLNLRKYRKALVDVKEKVRSKSLTNLFLRLLRVLKVYS